MILIQNWHFKSNKSNKIAIRWQDHKMLIKVKLIFFKATQTHSNHSQKLQDYTNHPDNSKMIYHNFREGKNRWKIKNLKFTTRIVTKALLWFLVFGWRLAFIWPKVGFGPHLLITTSIENTDYIVASRISKIV